MTDKQICQQAIFPFMLFLVANRGLSSKNQYYMDLAQDIVVKLLEGRDKAKLIRRLDRLAQEIINLIADKRTDLVNGHKLILALHALAQKIIDSGFVFRSEIIDLFGHFLEIEANQDTTIDGKPITNQDWLKLKESADKVTEKIFVRINDNLEFVKLR